MRTLTIIFGLIFICLISYSQNSKEGLPSEKDSITEQKPGCLTIVRTGLVLDDTINAPVYKNGYYSFFNSIKKKMLFTDKINYGESEFLIYMNIQIDSANKLKDVKIEAISPIFEKKFRKALPSLIEEIDHWESAYLKQDKSKHVCYSIDVEIYINATSVTIYLNSKDRQLIDSCSLKKPLNHH